MIWILEALWVAAAAAGGGLLALRAGGALRLDATPGGDMPFVYTADDALTKVLLVAALAVLTGLFLIKEPLARRGKLTPRRRRWIWLGIFATGAFMLTFAAVLKLTHPDKF